MMSYFNSTLPTNDSMKQSLENLQLESGLDAPALLSPFESHSHVVTQGWLCNLWKSIHYFKMELHLPSHHHPASTTTNDRTIIDTDLPSKHFNRDQIYLINIARIKLHVVFISDLLNHESNRIKENYRQGKKDRLKHSTFH